MSRTRVSRCAAAVAVVLSLAACGSSGSSQATGTSSASPSPRATAAPASPARLVRAAAATTTSAGASRFSVTSSTTVAGQSVTFTGTGAYDPATRRGSASFEMPGGGGTLEERVVADTLYLQVPGQPGFFALRLSDLLGTPLAGTADPTSSARLLDGVTEDVTLVGPDTVRGAATRRYRGTLDVQKALDRMQGAARELAQRAFASSTTPTPPFEVWIAEDGTVRRFVQTLDLRASDVTGGEAVTSTTTLELFDFGTAVDVQAPPPDQVKDGAPVLQAMRGMQG